MENSIEITIRKSEIANMVVSEGINAILKKEIMEENYITDVDIYENELIIYLKGKHEYNIKKTQHPARTSGIYLRKYPQHKEQ